MQAWDLQVAKSRIWRAYVFGRPRRLSRSECEALKLCWATFSIVSLLAQEFSWQLCYFLLIILFIMLCTHSSFNFWLAQLLLRRLSNFYCELLLLWERLELICVYTLCKPMPPWQHTTNLSFFFFNQCHHAEVSCTLGHGLCSSLYKNLRNILGTQEDKGNPTNSDSSLYVQRWHKWVECL